MSTNLIQVPLKHTAAIDLGAGLRHVIDKDYFQPSSLFASDLQTVTATRDVVAEFSDSKVDFKSPEVISQYLQILDALARKFPDDGIEFGWLLTIGHGRLALEAVHLIHTERMNAVYQLGAIYCALALKESRYTEDGLKKLCNYFQLAAGTWQYLQGMVEATPNRAPRECDSNTLECLEQLMMAQAQECIWQTAVANELKDSVIARLSMQASLYYQKAFEKGTQSPQIILEWLNHMRVKQYHFAAAAHLRMSNVALQSQQYGQQVAHLKVAAAKCAQAFKHKRYVNSFVIEDLSGLDTVIKDTLSAAEKENDLIYLQVVPLELDLKPIVGTNMVAPVVPEILKQGSLEEKLFADLLPYMILQVAQAFRERQDDFVVAEITNPINQANQKMLQFLNERNLPASIDAIQQPENLPDSLLQHAWDIKQRGGVEATDKKIAEVAELAFKLEQLVRECRGRLDMDESEDRQLVSMYGQRTRPPMEVAAQDIIGKLEKLDSYLSQAKVGDAHLRQLYATMKVDLEVYSGPQEQLQQVIPDSKYVALDSQVTMTIRTLRELLTQVDNLKAESSKLADEVEIRGRDHNILPKIIEQYKRDKLAAYNDDGSFNERVFEPVYEEHLRMYNPDLEHVHNLIQRQRQLQEQISNAYADFTTIWADRSSESQTRREKVLLHFESVYISYIELLGHLEEGSKFYCDFLVKGTAVVQECEQFLARRRVEAQEMEARNQHGMFPGVWRLPTAPE